MAKRKQTMYIVALGLLLLLIVMSPFQLTAWNNNNRVGQVYTTSFTEEPIPIVSPQTGQYTIEERLITIAKTMVAQTGIVMDSQLNITEASGENSYVIEKLQEQLERLTALGALPPVPISEKYNLILSQRTFFDMKNPEQTVTVWGIQATFADCTVLAIMDAETFVLYQVGIESPTDLRISQPKMQDNMVATDLWGIDPVQYMNYLGIDVGQWTWYGDRKEGYFRWSEKIPGVVYSYQITPNTIAYYMEVKYTTVEQDKIVAIPNNDTDLIQKQDKNDAGS